MKKDSTQPPLPAFATAAEEADWWRENSELLDQLTKRGIHQARVFMRALALRQLGQGVTSPQVAADCPSPADAELRSQEKVRGIGWFRPSPRLVLTRADQLLCGDNEFFTQSDGVRSTLSAAHRFPFLAF